MLAARRVCYSSATGTQTSSGYHTLGTFSVSIAALVKGIHQPSLLTFISLEMSSTHPVTPCPFCNQLFKKLGIHLPHCKERRGKDFPMYLSRKTIQKKAGPASSKSCPTCRKQFKRLDTHLWRSVQCGSQVDQSRIHLSSVSSGSSTGEEPIVESSSGLSSPSTSISTEPAHEAHSSGSVDHKVPLSFTMHTGGVGVCQPTSGCCGPPSSISRFS